MNEAEAGAVKAGMRPDELLKADGALNESAGIRVWAHMLDEAMEAK